MMKESDCQAYRLNRYLDDPVWQWGPEKKLEKSQIFVKLIVSMYLFKKRINCRKGMIVKISSNQLQAFYVLAREGNFTAAAKRIGLSQPAFSQRIAGLEDYFETTLFIRDKNETSLTAAGQKFLKYAETHKQLEDEIINELSDDSKRFLTGQIRIAGFSSVMRSLLLPALAKLMKQHQQLSIQTYTGELSELDHLFRTGRVDYLLFNKKIERSGVVSKFLGYEENVLVSHKNFRASEIYLDHDESDVTTSSYFRLLKRKPPQRKRYLDDVYGLLEGVKLGYGKAVIARHLIDDPRLIVENKKTVLKVPVYFVHHKANYYSQRHDEIATAITQYFSKQLSV